MKTELKMLWRVRHETRTMGGFSEGYCFVLASSLEEAADKWRRFDSEQNLGEQARPIYGVDYQGVCIVSE